VASAAGISVSTAAWVLIAIVGFAIELAACFGMYVLGHRPARPAPAATTLPSVTDDDLTATRHFFADPPQPTPPRGPRKRKPATPQASNVVAFPHPVIATLQANGGSVASNQDLARLMGVTEGEASKRVEEVRPMLDLRREGKRIVISLKRAAA